MKEDEGLRGGGYLGEALDAASAAVAVVEGEVVEWLSGPYPA